VSYRIDGILELERDFARVSQELSNIVRHAAITGAREGVAQAKARHRYKDQTGKLTKTAKAVSEVSTPGGATALMVWPMKYASFVENGTRRHNIPFEKTVGNPFLHFVWHGVPVTFARVDHPGNKAYAFAGDAYLKAERVLWREVDLGISRSKTILSK